MTAAPCPRTCRPARSQPALAAYGSGSVGSRPYRPSVMVVEPGPTRSPPVSVPVRRKPSAGVVVKRALRMASDIDPPGSTGKVPASARASASSPVASSRTVVAASVIVSISRPLRPWSANGVPRTSTGRSRAASNAAVVSSSSVPVAAELNRTGNASGVAKVDTAAERRSAVRPQLEALGGVAVVGRRLDHADDPGDEHDPRAGQRDGTAAQPGPADREPGPGTDAEAAGAGRLGRRRDVDHERGEEPAGLHHRARRGERDRRRSHRGRRDGVDRHLHRDDESAAPAGRTPARRRPSGSRRAGRTPPSGHRPAQRWWRGAR